MLVDDHSLVRMGFKLILESGGDFEVVAEHDCGEAVCQSFEASKPDVVVMDITMAGIGGLETIRRLVAKVPRVRILALSAHEDTSYPTRALQAGALGYLSKRSAPEALIAAVQAVAKGQGYLDAPIAQRLALHGINGVKGPTELLSAREFEVFIKLARGQNVAQISQALNVSGSTIGTHLYHVKQKLGLTNQAEMTLMAMRYELIDVKNGNSV
jgi:two-component system, NarL family, invasion response regulator UvrY